jgi:hypothetical protein
MRSDHFGQLLLMAAALAAGAPLRAHDKVRIIWVEMCDARHSGRKVELPLDREKDAPGIACHAACGILPGRRSISRERA